MTKRDDIPYLGEIDATPLLSAEEERDIALRVADGDPEARDHLVRANLRLVVSVARGYRRRGLPLEDLIAEGNLGLIRAAEGFDPSLGVRFTTYASYWVNQSIRRAVMIQGRLLRLPAYMFTLLAKWKRAAAALERRLGRTPTAEEVGRALGLRPKRLARALEALRAERLLAAPQAEEGCDAPNLDAEPGRDATPLDELEAKDASSRVSDGLGLLDGGQAEIIRLRYGLATGRPVSTRAVCDRLGLTRDRVCQSERAALARLRRYVGVTAEASLS